MTKDWMQIGIFVFIAGMLGFIIVKHTGSGTGDIKPEIVWTALLSIFATKVVDFAFKIKSAKNGK